MPKRLPVSRKVLRALSLDQLIELNGLVCQLIQTSKEGEKRKASQKREVVEEKTRDNKTYRLVSIRCGKENCKCANNGYGHGPYWYAFWSERGVTKCEYVGRKLARRPR
jgi:Family of unknown function (DUF6788)